MPRLKLAGHVATVDCEPSGAFQCFAARDNGVFGPALEYIMARRMAETKVNHTLNESVRAYMHVEKYCVRT